jgi:hypothetical protein
MKKNLIIVAALSLFFSCDKDEESPVVSKKDQLTGTTQRGWYIHSMTPDERCSSGADDTWTFFSDGSFEYNNGTITEDITDEGGCGDFANLLGSWELTENETHIKIIAKSRKDDPSTTFDLAILEGTLTSMSEEKFIITAKDPSSDDEGTVEFRRR